MQNKFLLVCGKRIANYVGNGRTRQPKMVLVKQKLLKRRHLINVTKRTLIKALNLKHPHMILTE